MVRPSENLQQACFNHRKTPPRHGKTSQYQVCHYYHIWTFTLLLLPCMYYLWVWWVAWGVREMVEPSSPMHNAHDLYGTKMNLEKLDPVHFLKNFTFAFSFQGFQGFYNHLKVIHIKGTPRSCIHTSWLTPRHEFDSPSSSSSTRVTTAPFWPESDTHLKWIRCTPKCIECRPHLYISWPSCAGDFQKMWPLRLLLSVHSKLPLWVTNIERSLR